MKLFDKGPRLRKVKENSSSTKIVSQIIRREMNVRNENEQNMMRVRPVNIGFYDSVQFVTDFNCISVKL